MNKNLKLILVILLANLVFNTSFAQKKDSIRVGTVTGLLKDSVHNYVMQAATLALYKVQGDSLISYQLSSNTGRFEFKLMPVGIPLRVVVTNVGYGQAKKDFIIPVKTKKIDLQTINMTRQTDYLKEVNISSTPPPIQMKGDTLEFNAGAFKMDPNAVAEDMLRKLPGVTVWGDGVITVNGKAISKLLVDGKDFFDGGNNKIALQNIPKNAIQKVQVYHDKEDPDKLNPKSNMNIVLKKDKKDGYFGKIGGGYGTDKRYAGDGMISYFSPKTQLNLVGATNNVNKDASTASTLVGYNSFKGEGISNDYYSNFERSGFNTFKALGASYSHDYSKDADQRQSYYKLNSLKGDYFLTEATNNNTSTGESLLSLGTNGQQLSNNSSVSKNSTTGRRASANYNKRNERGSIAASISNYNNQTTSNSVDNNHTINTLTNLETQNMQVRNETSKQNTVSGSVSVNTQRYWDNGKSKYRSFDSELSYSFSGRKSTRDRSTITDFTATDATQNKYFNRQYLTDQDGNNHTITTNFSNFIELFQDHTPYIRTDFLNKLTINNSNEDARVGDISGTGGYTANDGLTNITSTHIVNERPGLSFNKSFSRYLDNRFSKSWQYALTTESEIYSFSNTSLKAFQNINRNFFYFLPSASITRSNYQIGQSSKTFTLSYNTSVNYPQLYQMAPLNDDANVYSIAIGNPKLKPEYAHELTFRFSYYDQLKNSLNNYFAVTGGVTDNNIADSTYYDALGRNVHYYINGTGSRYLRVNDNARKIFKLKEHQIEISGNLSGGYRQNPSSVNGVNYQTESSNIYAAATLTYTYKGILNSSIGENFNGNKTVQGSLSRSTNYTWETNFGTAFALPKSIFFNTRVKFRNTKSSFSNNIYYTIWNADIGYRFLKGNNAEIKLSALDLLHQNRNIDQYAYNNTVGTNTSNVLQQYFMFTIAYYPRKFGLGGKK